MTAEITGPVLVKGTALTTVAGSPPSVVVKFLKLEGGDYGTAWVSAPVDAVTSLDDLRNLLQELVEYPKAINGTLMNLGGKGNQDIHDLVARTSALLARLGEEE